MTTRRSIDPLFRRAAHDVATVEDDALVRAQVEQVLATECNPDGTGGELPWRTSFGSPLHLLRHRNASDAARELARVWIRDAIAKWVPRAKVTAIEIDVNSELFTMRVRLAGVQGVATVSRTVPRK